MPLATFEVKLGNGQQVPERVEQAMDVKMVLPAKRNQISSAIVDRRILVTSGVRPAVLVVNDQILHSGAVGVLAAIAVTFQDGLSLIAGLLDVISTVASPRPIFSLLFCSGGVVADITSKAPRLPGRSHRGLPAIIAIATKLVRDTFEVAAPFADDNACPQLTRLSQCGPRPTFRGGIHARDRTVFADIGLEAIDRLRLATMLASEGGLWVGLLKIGPAPLLRAWLRTVFAIPQFRWVTTNQFRARGAGL